MDQMDVVIKLLTSINEKLEKLSSPVMKYQDGKWMDTGDLQLDVNVTNDSLTVDGDVTAHDPR